MQLRYNVHVNPFMGPIKPDLKNILALKDGF